jgi:DNA-binding HxlR family transcriptional regulator
MVRARLNELASAGLVGITKQLGPYNSEWGLTDAGRRHLAGVAALAELKAQRTKLEKELGK